MTKVCIPAALQINLDDIGWWCGRDDRKIKGPSRTGFCRNHLPVDYVALEKLGQAINQKIACAMVVGEWDMENILSKEIKNFSHYGENWNNSEYRDQKQLDEAAEIINSSKHIDVALHGLYHGYYTGNPEINPDISDFYIRKDGKLYVIPDEEIINRIEWFYRILEKSGIKKDVTTFIPPSAAYEDMNVTCHMQKYGIKYSCPPFEDILEYGITRPECINNEDVFFEGQIITLNRRGDGVPWDTIDGGLDDASPCFGIMGLHWPNILNPDPEKNEVTVKKFIPYFRRCKEIFGIIISRDMPFCATQMVMRKYAKLKECESEIIIDLSGVPETDKINDSFYISCRKMPKRFENCTIGEIEEHKDFFNIEIKTKEKFFKIK